MIEPIFTGRLGNVMFQIAAAYGYSLKHGMDYRVPLWGNGLTAANNNTDKHIRDGVQVSDIMLKYLNWFPNVKRGNAVADTFDGAYLKEFPEKKDYSRFVRYEENGRHEYNEIPFHENIVIDGFFQTEKYFKEYRKEIVNLFNLPYEKIEGWTSIHVRRGDYVQYYTSFPPVDERYLGTAMRLMARNGFKKFMLFSDDMQWCKENLSSQKYPEYAFLYSDGRNEFEDMAKGSCCEHNIISNSTFSWWQAWLNQNPNKLVISPSKYNWFGKRVKLSTEDIIPETWVQITF
jgi:hypothetical protein